MSKIERDGFIFFIKLNDKARAEIDCEKHGNELHVVRSFTPEEFRGRGIASSIMQEVVKFAGANHLHIVPACEFAKNYCIKNKC